MEEKEESQKFLMKLSVTTALQYLKLNVCQKEKQFL